VLGYTTHAATQSQPWKQKQEVLDHEKQDIFLSHLDSITVCGPCVYKKKIIDTIAVCFEYYLITDVFTPINIYKFVFTSKYWN
jgi:hypothetical protein